MGSDCLAAIIVHFGADMNMINYRVISAMTVTGEKFRAEYIDMHRFNNWKDISDTDWFVWHDSMEDAKQAVSNHKKQFEYVPTITYID
jgi:hypothetical protein